MANKVNLKNIDNGNEMKKFIQMILIVTFVFVVFYILTVFINKEKESTTSNNNTSNKVSIQYDEILVGNIFKQNEDSYYVLIEDFDDTNVQVYEAFLKKYSQKKEAKRVYFSVLNNMFNLKYFKDKSNLTNDISKFCVSGTTLLEISKGKIVKSYQNDSSIREILTKISEEKTDDKK